MFIIIICIGILIALLVITVWLVLSVQRSYRMKIDQEPLLIGRSRPEGVLIDSDYGRITPSTLHPVDQHSCNACWAISSCQTVTDRLHLRGEIPDDELNYYAYHDLIVSKTPEIDGCGTGIILDTGLEMFITDGAPLMSETRDRYFNDTPVQGDAEARRYRIRDWKRLSSIPEIKLELETSGPVVAVMNLYESFNSFKGSGVYQPHPSESTDSSMAHMISIIGYDDRDNTWIIRNSYGSNFGYHGYAKTYQGDRRIGIEDHVYAPVL